MSWATELLCDFYALSRFGPSAVCALAEYFTVIGAMDDLNTTHPPGNLRIKLLLDSLGIVIDSRLSGTLAPWVDVLSRTTPRSEAWADYLSALFSSHVADLESVSHGMGTGAYPFAERVAAIGEIADRLHAGVPGTDVIQLADASSARPVDSDVINAAWIARREDAKTPYDKLGKKAIDSITFIDRWHKRGATRPNGLDASGNPAGIPPASGGALSAADLLGRLQRTDEHAIVATPLVHLPRGAGLDLRVGRHFIAFRRSSTSAFDPLNRKQDPRSMQIAYEMAWDEKYMLHPGELVLGATLEYLVIPADLTAQVLTRSSYGRLGLLSATAVQVHPNLHGCLTLNS